MGLLAAPSPVPLKLGILPARDRSTASMTV